MQKRRFVGVLVFIVGVLSEMLIFSSLSYIVTFNRFMDAVGLTLLPAVTANVLYNHISEKYGALPNIAYRLITTLYAYIIPICPQTPDSIFAMAKLLVPLAAWLFIKMLYKKKSYFEKRQNKFVSHALMSVLVVFMISTVMLISCQFRFGALVIATESMTGELNKGDAIVYEEYGEQLIKEQDIVVFNSNGKRVVHRVVDIQRINGKNRYFTKGDANDAMDAGYITDDKIEGVVLFKVAYIGYPSIWIRNIFR
jgi:signal peptidase